jgi:hypothetical protein
MTGSDAHPEQPDAELETADSDGQPIKPASEHEVKDNDGPTQELETADHIGGNEELIDE